MVSKAKELYCRAGLRPRLRRETFEEISPAQCGNDACEEDDRERIRAGRYRDRRFRRRRAYDLCPQGKLKQKRADKSINGIFANK